MDSFVAVIIISVINVAGWVYTRIYSMGKLNGKVENLEQTCERHEKVINDGLVQGLSELKSEVAGLTATLNTYIDMANKQK